MNLLLLLSALLSALTGVVGGAQRVERAPALARSLEQPAASVAVAIPAWRAPLAAFDAPGVARVAVRLRAFVVTFAPLWANRRRE